MTLACGAPARGSPDSQAHGIGGESPLRVGSDAPLASLGRTEPLFAYGIAAAAVSLLVLQWSIAAGKRWWRRRMYFARMQNAADGERRARTILERAGYEIRGAQVEGAWTVFCDGAPLRVPLRVDYLVARDDRLFVAEVKTGRLAPRLDTAATRRQLLEYRCAFPVDGILLVDGDAGTLQVVTFDLPVLRESRPQRFRWILLLCVVLIAVTIALFYRE